MTKLSTYIVQEILTCEGKPRIWIDQNSAVAVARELAKFFDHLMAWEETTKERFLPVLKKDSKTGIAKAFPLLCWKTRQDAYVPAFCEQLRSQRIKRLPLFESSKLVISDEAHLTLVLDTDSSGKRQSRKRKPAQR